MEDVDVDRAFWAGRRVLITGHTGFKGSWLAIWLASLGADVWGYALPPQTDPSLFELAALGRDVRGTFGDVRDARALIECVRHSRPSIVFHLAAQALVRRSYADPRETFETNVMGSVNLLEALRTAHGVNAVVIVTSDKCYENDETHAPRTESHALGGSDPYSASKACAEIVASAYRRSFFNGRLPIATARAGNVVGGGDWSSERIVPDVIERLTNGTELTLRYPGAVRPWQHVLEPLCGYIVLAQRLIADPALAAAWNFGPAAEAAVTVADLVQACFAGWGEPQRSWRRSELEHPPEHSYLRLDSSKAARELGVATTLSFQETCDWTVEWYRRWREGARAKDLCLEQIARYRTRL